MGNAGPWRCYDGKLKRENGNTLRNEAHVTSMHGTLQLDHMTERVCYRVGSNWMNLPFSGTRGMSQKEEF